MEQEGKKKKKKPEFSTGKDTAISDTKEHLYSESIFSKATREGKRDRPQSMASE